MPFILVLHSEDCQDFNLKEESRNMLNVDCVALRRNINILNLVCCMYMLDLSFVKYV
jgi:hypothetical protein